MVESGIGINCTKMKYLPKLLESFREACQEAHQLAKASLVLYPDGGQTYDPIARTWSNEEDGGDDIVWAQMLMKEASRMQRCGLWSKIVVGGCCKASFGKIEALRRILDES
jgi:homocysteine S-methyltransferase